MFLYKDRFEADQGFVHQLTKRVPYVFPLKLIKVDADCLMVYFGILLFHSLGESLVLREAVLSPIPDKLEKQLSNFRAKFGMKIFPKYLT
jgi:hypothetical protein